ncbi:MAG: hypothetical protein LC791_05750 [Acidobacteria bacterium]|nr:hypothetical protein [Acidobacteriota bacterium]
MAVTARFDHHTGLLRVVVTGAWPSIDEQRQLRLWLMAQGTLTDGTRALFDLREMDIATAPYHDGVQQTVAVAMQHGGLPRRRAYLALDGAQFGFIRMLQAVSEPTGVVMGCFTDEAEAVRWLLSDEPVGNAC